MKIKKVHDAIRGSDDLEKLGGAFKVEDIETG